MTLRWTPEQLDAYKAKKGRQTATNIDRVHKRQKYGNKKVDGFDSKREARRYEELLLREKSGEIAYLSRQMEFPLEINGVLVCTYIADFAYIEAGEPVVEDAKGYRTPVYRLKKKLMKAVRGIDIREV